jgi:integrase
MAKIDTVDARNRLKPRDAAYIHHVSAGFSLRYRKPKANSTGTWNIWYRDPHTKEVIRRSMGDLAHIPNSERFTFALKEAQKLIGHFSAGGSISLITVGEACKQYVDFLNGRNRANTAKDALSRYTRWVLGHKVASIPLTKLTRSSLEKWRAEMTQMPVVINPFAEKLITRERSAASINRDMTALRAALNYAHDNGFVTSDQAWRIALKAVPNADKPRAAYLNRSQRDAVLKALDPKWRPFYKVLSLLPLRSGVVARLKVSDFNAQFSTLTLRADKRVNDRTIPLTAELKAIFVSQAKGKTSDAALLSNENGKAFTKDQWKKVMEAMVKELGFTEGVVTTTFRHSTITDLVSLHGLDIHTVAKIAGTSARMIEKHYGHLLHEHALKGLEKLSG